MKRASVCEDQEKQGRKGKGGQEEGRREGEGGRGKEGGGRREGEGEREREREREREYRTITRLGRASGMVDQFRLHHLGCYFNL